MVGFDKLPADVQYKLLNDPMNKQPMALSANCSKGCKVEGVNGGWEAWNGQQVSPIYKQYLENIQNQVRTKIQETILKGGF